MAVMLPGYTVGEPPQSEYVMGAKIGTAIHLWLEEEIKATDWGVPETKVIVGEIKGYGVIKSTSDLYVPDLKAIVDHKTSTIEKLSVYKSLEQMGMLEEAPAIEPDTYRKGRKTVKRYLVQGNMYGLGVENRGDPVSTVALNFIPRDAKKVSDMWVHEVDYSRETALRALARGQKIWDAMVAGKQWDTFKSDDDCYVCEVLRKNIN